MPIKEFCTLLVYVFFYYIENSSKSYIVHLLVFAGTEWHMGGSVGGGRRFNRNFLRRGVYLSQVYRSQQGLILWRDLAQPIGLLSGVWING